MLPETVRVPASEAMREALPSVTLPLCVLSPLMLRSAPPVEMPVPLSVRLRATVMPPEYSSAAPFCTATELALPNALLAVARMAPLVMPTVPVKLFVAPEIVSVPLPVFARLPDPVRKRASVCAAATL